MSAPLHPSDGNAPRDDTARYASLVRKYRALARKYEDLVQKFEANASERFGVFKLAWWAMRASESGLVLMRGETVVLSNPRFDALNRGVEGDRGWTAQGTHWASLRAYTLATARELEATPGHHAKTQRLERDGGRRVIEVQVERVDAPVPFPLAVALVRDVTDRVRDERELALARETLAQRSRAHAVGELAPGIAHDLNNSLGAMGLRLQTMRAEATPGSALAAELDVLVGIVRDASRLSARMRGFVRGPGDGELGSLDLGSTIRDAAELARPEIEQRASRAGGRVAIDVDTPATLPSVQGVAADVRHVFINLLLNASDAMPRGGRIRIAAERRGQTVRVTVADDGTGVPRELTERIFEAFFTTKGDGGSGLGLAMARASMTRLGGSIRVRPGVRTGTVFELEFPVAADEDHGRPAAPLPRRTRAR